MEPSGKAWVSQFPTDRTTRGLELVFRRCVQGFILALEAAGAHVEIAATRRPVQRAYLMHFAWMIAKEGLEPGKVPSRPDVPIDWQAGGLPGAQAMVKAYALRYRPSLVSRHIEGKAIDMSITWTEPLSVRDGYGKRRSIEVGDERALWELGGTWGVWKLEADPPHWSTDGH